MRNNFGGFFALLLCIVMVPASVIKAQQATEPKVDPPPAGLNGVSSPRCIYCPQPDYSEKVRKAKIEGVVLLDVTVTTDGQIANPVGLKGPNAVLNNKALEAVRNWKMKPARGPDGQPVNCRVRVEIAFHLY
jgi:TonB family protein